LLCKALLVLIVTLFEKLKLIPEIFMPVERPEKCIGSNSNWFVFQSIMYCHNNSLMGTG